MLFTPATILTCLAMVSSVLSHGRLMDPPARNSMWRLGFPNPVNYNDNELYCGGRVTQWARNKGKCGVCGDPHHYPNKDHEVGGKYANGIISRQYKQGDVIEVTVHITANHKGYFEFRICPVQNPKVEVTQECLDEHLMQMANGEGARYALPEGKSNTFFNVSLRLPSDMTCKQCVIQWKYRTGNTWDKDENGKFCVGCGPQEEFYNCADVAIHASENSQKMVTNADNTMVNKNEMNQGNENEMKQKNADNKIAKENVRDKISEYGKQKVHFVQKLQENKYSTKSEIVDSDNNQEILFSSHVGQVEPQKSQTDSTMRFGYIDNNYENVNVATNVGLISHQPPGVAYQWKSGNSNIPDHEKIRRRFGFASSSIRKNNSRNGDQQKHFPMQSTVSGDEQMQSVQRDELRHEKNYKIHKVPTKMITISNSVSQYVTTSQPEVSSITEVQSGHAAFDSAAMKLHDNLRKMLKNIRKEPKRDNFLRRWKLSRLSNILAKKALNASRSSLPPSSQLKTRPLLHAEKHQDPQVTRSISPFTPAPAAAQVVYHKESSDHNTAVSPSPLPWKKYQNAVQESRQNYLKKRLPSWLVKAWKLKQQEPSENTEYSSNYNNEQDHTNNDEYHNNNDEYHNNNDENNQIDDVRKTSEIEVNRNVDSIQGSNNEKWYNIIKDSSNSIVGKKVSNGLHDKRHDNIRDYDTTGRISEDTPSRMMQFKQNLKTETAMSKTTRKDESTAGEKHSEGIWKDETESLVRYIVSLLFSQKNKDDYDGKSNTRGEYSSGSIRMTKPVTRDSTLKENTTHSHSWFVPDQVEVSSMTRKDLDIEGRRNSPILDQGRMNNQRVGPFSQVAETQQYNSETKNPPPVVRAASLPFNGLILGSDYRNDQSQTENDLQIDYRLARKQNDVWNAGRKSVNNGRNYGNNDANYDTQFKEDLNQETVPEQRQRNRWIDSEEGRFSTNRNDYHHLWATRAQKRQNYYKKQDDSIKSQLKCKSLVTLGGDMDRWCTNNCNANFCPASMCVCTRSSTSSYGSNPRSFSSYENIQTWPETNSRINDKLTLYRDTEYNPQAARTHDHSSASLFEDRPLSSYPSSKNEESYFKSKPSPRQAAFDQSLITNNIIDSNSNVDLLSYSPIGSHSNHIQEPQIIDQSEDVMHIDRPSNTEQYFPRHSEKLIGHLPDYTREEESLIGQARMQEPIRNYNIRRAPYGGHNTITSNVQRYHRNTERPIHLNWLPNSRQSAHNLEHPSKEQDVDDLIKPYSKSKNFRNNNDLIISNVDNFSQNPNYNMHKIVDNDRIGQNQFYSQFVGMKYPPIRQDVPSRLHCKAIGAYSGMKHFDEWCDVTCQSTMCPLLLCSCDS